MKNSILDIQENIKKVIIGKDKVIELILTAMIAGGHILLEDMPGTGKTLLAKSIAKTIDGTFRRIQMTPDLLPSDITGLNIYNQKNGEFEFHPGPVFTNLLLADEINRATPRTQASLLECMEEKQVTIDGETRRLEEPFVVIATQNPIETAGTFPLPKAQLDRFLMKLSMGPMEAEQEKEILNRFLLCNPYEKLVAVATKEDLKKLQEEYHKIYVHPELMEYMQQICMSTRNRKEIQVGVSVRGTLSLMRAAQAHALLLGRDYVVPEDIKNIAIPVLAHRLILDGGFYNATACELQISKIVETITLPTEEWNARS